MTPPDGRSGGHMPSTYTMTLVTVTVAIGFGRVFDQPGFLGPVLVAAIGGHVMAAVTRRLAAGWATVVMLVAGVIVTIDTTHWSATTFGVPTPATIGVVRSGLDAAVEVLRSEAAPVAPDAGLLFVIVAALWVAAWSADRLTFTYAAPVEALVPSATIFVIVTALAGPHHRWSSTVLYAAAVVLHVLVNRHLDARSDVEASGDGRAVLRGIALATVALTLGLTAVWTVPALTPDGVLQIRSRRTRTVVNPLVDIGNTLTRQTDDTMFEVTAERPRYWRLMGLDEFDGRTWDTSSLGADRAAPVDSAPSSEPMWARFEITNLGGSLAPAPYRPVDVSEGDLTGGNDPRLDLDDESGTIYTTESRGLTTGMSYTVWASTPVVGARQVREARGPIPRDVATRYTELPADFPADLERTARGIVAGADGPYEQALALQNFFLDPANGFRYDTSVPADTVGDSDEAIEAFLRHRRGFCEQFAGTFGALARSLGLPTRLAIGFTWGDAIRSDGTATTYRVTGRNAHSWPEVYFAGLGWLAFEPTPGRGNPSASSYTGVAPAQDATPTTVPGLVEEPTTSVPATVTPDDPDAESTGTTVAERATAPVRSQGQAHRGPTPTPWIAGGAVVFTLCLVPVIGWLRRRRRMRNADTAARRVRLVWADVLHAWRPLGVARTPVDTDRDMADRLTDRLAALDGPDDAVLRSARRLGELAAAAAWDQAAMTRTDAEEAEAVGRVLITIALAHRSRASRLVGRFDPRLPVTT